MTNQKRKKKPDNYNPACEPARPHGLPSGAWFDVDDDVWRDGEGNIIGDPPGGGDGEGDGVGGE